MSKKLDFHIFNNEYAKAISETVDKNGVYLERKYRREYSILFHTPLHVAYKIDLSFILQNLYEHGLQNKTKQQLGSIIADFIPELGQAIEEDNEEFMRQLEATILEKNKKKQEKLAKPVKKQSEIKEDEVKSPEINLSFSDEDPDLI